MRKNIKYFLFLIAPIILIYFLKYNISNKNTQNKQYIYNQTNKYGYFITTHYALIRNDFKSAYLFSKELDKKDKYFNDIKIISEFLSEGKIEKEPKINKDSPFVWLINDIYLIKNKKYLNLYNKYKKEDSVLYSPIKIWSFVAVNKHKEAFYFINELKIDKSLKHFIKGQIFVHINDISNAIKEFNQININYLNFNDYSYIYSFLIKNNKNVIAKKLKEDFLKNPNANFLSKFEPYNIELNINNQISFTLLHMLSHIKTLFYLDISLVMIKGIEVLSNINSDIINYCYGQYYQIHDGKYEEYYKKIDTKSYLYVLTKMQKYNSNKNIDILYDILKEHPLFISAIIKITIKNIQQGNEKLALERINNVLNNPKITKFDKIILLSLKTELFLSLKEIKKAEKTLNEVLKYNPKNLQILSLQSRIWSLTNQNKEKAYQYAIALIKNNPLDLDSWITFAMAIKNKTGIDSAIEILNRVSSSKSVNSQIFDYIGDLYLEKKDYNNAYKSYITAKELIDDNLISIPLLDKKIIKTKKMIEK